MNIWVVGAGGIGRIVAATLCASYGDDSVCLVPQRRDQVAALGRGLDVRRPSRRLVAHPTVCALEDLDGMRTQPDVALVCVKSADTRTVGGRLATTIGPGTAVVSLQNGLNPYLRADMLGPERVVGAVLAFDGVVVGPAAAAQYRTEQHLALGGLPGTSPDHVDRTAAVLRACAPVSVTANLHGALWGKLAANAAANAVCAITGRSIGDILADPAQLDSCIHLTAEAVAVAHAAGVVIEPTQLLGIEPRRWFAAVHAPVDPRLAADYADALAAVRSLRSTMCRDLDAGRPTEVDWINGDVIRHGDRVGVPTPRNCAALAEIHRLERRYAGIGRVPGGAGVDHALEPVQPSK